MDIAKEGQAFQTEAARFLESLLKTGFASSDWNIVCKYAFVERLEPIIYNLTDDFTNSNYETWINVYCSIWTSIEKIDGKLPDSLKSRIAFIFKEAMEFCAKDQPEISKKLGVELLSSLLKVG